ncbi:MAG: hypothetical protein ABWY82_06020 [Tardiphaga sp.]
MRGNDRACLIPQNRAGLLVAEGIWFVRDADDIEIALRDLEASSAFADEVLVQDLIAGTTETRARRIWRAFARSREYPDNRKRDVSLRRGLQRLVVVAGAVALRCREVAVLVVVVLDGNVLRLLRFVVALFRRLALPASSAHFIPFRRLNRRLLCVPIRGNRMI